MRHEALKRTAVAAPLVAEGRKLWPWAHDFWKPKDQLRNLVRAGALIAAAIDRLQYEQE